MPELLSVHGRCPRCSQVLNVPAGQLQNVFRCARCQYRVPGSALVEEARLSPPRAAAHDAASVLGPFEEDSDDQHTRVLLPGGPDVESEIPLDAVLVRDGTPSSSYPAPPGLALQRFDAVASDADDQQTRLHMPGSFDAPAPARRPAPPPQRPPSAARREATMIGVPPAPVLTRFDRAGNDPDDQQTRLHLPDEPEPARRPPVVSRDQTSLGVAPTASPVNLERFDRVAEDAEDQRTRLHVPISYEDDTAVPTGSAEPHLIAPVAPSVRSLSFEPPASSSASDRFGRATLQLSSSMDDWLHERRTSLLLTLAVLTAIIGPGLDAVFGGARHGTSVIVSNLVLFFLWTLLFAWLGKLRNAQGAWALTPAWARVSTALRLMLEDIAALSRLPSLARYLLLAELCGVLGLTGLGLSSVLTISRLVWNWPGEAAGLWAMQVWSSALIAMSVIAARRAASVPARLAPQEIAAPTVAHFPAVLDLSVPPNLPSPSGTTLLHQVIEVLSEWQPREWPDQGSYIAALERHFTRRMSWARVEREHWFGARRADGVAHFIINESLLIEVVRGFDAEVAERINTRMRAQARVWRGKPALIVVFDASRAALFGGAGSELLEALHQSYPMLTVRMPSARTSLL